MNSTIPNTPDDQREMLLAIGKESMEALFDSVPQNVRLKRGLDLPDGLSEDGVTRRMKSLAKTGANTEDLVCFLGAGAYDHCIPAVIDHLLMRQEFYTAYTPYQPEISQGTLQAIFEYQSMICLLTGMDVSNASMYDGASAAAEAVLLSCRETKRNTALVARSFSPQGREVICTYARFQGIHTEEFGMKNGVCDLADLEGKLTDDTACVVVQNPNFLGSVEELSEIGKLAKDKGALFIVSCDPISLAILKTPGEAGADIAVGEGQPLGLPVSFGGPTLGFFAANEKYLRKMPGRIAGQTADKEGKRGFVLTVQTREQHIRREKATSNICSNQALCALAATIYLTALGKNGLVQAATLCAERSHYAYEKLIATGRFKPLWNAPFFKEFALGYKGDIGRLNNHLFSKGILGGYDLGRDYVELENGWLVAVTEKRTKEEIDQLVKAVAEA